MVQSISLREFTLVELEESEYDCGGVGAPIRLFYVKVDWGSELYVDLRYGTFYYINLYSANISGFNLVSTRRKRDAK